MERGVYAASTWKNERFRISCVSMNLIVKRHECRAPLNPRRHEYDLAF
jgi:hypothetical protein